MSGKKKTVKQRQKAINALHPRSRKAEYAKEAAARQIRMDKQKNDRHSRMRKMKEKFEWFLDNFDKSKQTYTEEEMHEFIERYLHRFDAELAELKSKRERSVHPPPKSKREDFLDILLQLENAAFKGPGFEVPDFMDAMNAKLFLMWDRADEGCVGFKTRYFVKGQPSKEGNTLGLKPDTPAPSAAAASSPSMEDDSDDDEESGDDINED